MFSNFLSSALCTVQIFCCCCCCFVFCLLFCFVVVVVLCFLVGFFFWGEAGFYYPCLAPTCQREKNNIRPNKDNPPIIWICWSIKTVEVIRRQTWLQAKPKFQKMRNWCFFFAKRKIGLPMARKQKAHKCNKKCILWIGAKPWHKIFKYKRHKVPVELWLWKRRLKIPWTVKTKTQEQMRETRTTWFH